VLEFLNQPNELGKQSGILVQLMKPWNVGLLDYRSDLGRTNQGNKKEYSDDGRALHKITPRFIK
jgi:hypothetical protein